MLRARVSPAHAARLSVLARPISRQFGRNREKRRRFRQKGTLRRRFAYTGSKNRAAFCGPEGESHAETAQGALRQQQYHSVRAVLRAGAAALRVLLGAVRPVFGRGRPGLHSGYLPFLKGRRGAWSFPAFRRRVGKGPFYNAESSAGEKERIHMKIVVLKSPRFLAPILRLIFKMGKDEI